MCKIIAFTDFSKIQNQDKVIEDVANKLLETETDGFGYAIVGSNGVFGEKCAGSEKFHSRFTTADIVKDPIFVQKNQTFGQYTKAKGAAMFHGRISTNSKGLVNTHPMREKNWYLIHNGVVTDSGAPYKKQTQNDSEDVLHRLIEGISSVEQNLSGYYAIAAIDPKLRLHIIRDRIASLFVAYSGELESYIFGTTEELIEFACESANVTCGPIEEFKPDYYALYEGSHLLKQEAIQSKGYTALEARWSEKSLGRDLNNWPTDPYDISDATKWRGESTYDYLAADNMSEDDILREIANMDASYTILDESEQQIATWEYRKLDPISQASCTIIRPDGTEIPPLAYMKGA